VQSVSGVWIQIFRSTGRSNGVGRGGQSPGGPERRGSRVPAKKIKNNFSVTMKITTSGYQTLERFIATLATSGVYERLVHVAETFNRFADFGL